MNPTRRQLLAALAAAPIAGRVAIAAAARPAPVCRYSSVCRWPFRSAPCKFATGGIVKGGPAMLGFGDHGPEAWIPLSAVRPVEVSLSPLPLEYGIKVRNVVNEALEDGRLDVATLERWEREL